MIPASYYHNIYLFVVTIITVILCKKIYKQKNNSLKNEQIILGIIFVLIFSIFIGGRPYSPYFGDSQAYFNAYYRKLNNPYQFINNKNSYIFYNLLSFFASLNVNPKYFFTLIAVLYFGFPILSFYKIFPERNLFAFFIFLGAFSTYAYSVNGLRAGIAASIFYCAVSYHNNKYIAIIFLLLSYGFHHSMHVSILAFILVYYYSKPKTYLIFWIICLFMAIFHVTFFQDIFSKFTDEKGAAYLVNSTLNNVIKVGRMRYDFALYSSIPIIISYYIYTKLKVNNEEYNFILSLYILLNSLWLLCMYALFTNRIAYLSWQLYPIVLGYPFLSKKINIDFLKYSQNRLLAVMAILHLGFTLFMSLVYYA